MLVAFQVADSGGVEEAGPAAEIRQSPAAFLPSSQAPSSGRRTARYPAAERYISYALTAAKMLLKHRISPAENSQDGRRPQSVSCRMGN